VKKKLFFLMLVSLLATSSVFAAPGRFGIGVGFGSPTIVLNVLVPMGPMSLDVDLGWSAWGLGNSFSSFFAAVDFLLWQPELVSNLHFFLGVGPRLVLWGESNHTSGMVLGARVPIGIDWTPINNLSLFLKVVPGLGARLVDSHWGSGVVFTMDWGLGVRFLF
jgi:hypothetical protein